MIFFLAKIKAWLRLILTNVLTLCQKTPAVTKDDLRQMEFKTSTQQMGIRFTEPIRRVFRHKWLKKS